jgi:hypothetical protein
MFFGGAIHNTQNGTALNITACTLSGNSIAGTSGTRGGGGINNDGGSTAQIANSIVALNTSAGGPDLNGAFTSQGHNLIGKSDGSTGFTNGANGDQAGTVASPLNPLLGALADNGGPTPTMALHTGSSAINADSSASTVPQRDQRGYARSGVRDIGAFEFAGSPFRVTAVTKSGSSVTASFYGVAGETDRLERKLSLTDGTDWQPISGVSDLVPNSDGPTQITDPTASASAAFYRVRVVPSAP